MDHGRFLSREERYEIARLRDARVGVREIARAVGRDPGTISRELARNGAARTGRYEPERAHTLAYARRRRPRPRKLAGNARLREWVQERLDVQDSPEQIAGRLPVVFPRRSGDADQPRGDLSGDLCAPGRAATPADAQPSAHRSHGPPAAGDPHCAGGWAGPDRRRGQHPRPSGGGRRSAGTRPSRRRPDHGQRHVELGDRHDRGTHHRVS